MREAGQFYANRVLKDWKDKDRAHADWVRAWLAALADLQAYVKRHHATGLEWNPRGAEASSLAGDLLQVTRGEPSKTPATAVPRKELRGKRWVVEGHAGDAEVTVDQVEPGQSVSVSRCEGCTVRVAAGECGGVAVDGCRRTAVVVAGAVASSVGVADCQSVQIQVRGTKLRSFGGRCAILNLCT